MQSCHIVVAVRLKPRMTILRKTKKSSPLRSYLRRRASIGLIQPNRTDCLYDISQLGATSEALSWMGSCGGAYATARLRLRLT